MENGRGFYEALVGRVAEKAEVIARYDGNLTWIKDAFKEGNFDGIRINSDGSVWLLFSGIDWTDEVEVESKYLSMTAVEIEKDFVALATQRDRDEKARMNARKEADLKTYRDMYKEALDKS